MALFVLAALPAAFMYQTLLLGRPLVRDDAAAMVYPIFHALDASLAQGSLYLWDAQQWCGLPALAGGETTGLYPPTLLLFGALPWMAALHVSYWLHLAVAAMACFWVARNLGASRGAALVAGAAYAFSGYQAAHLIHFDHITALAHLPLAVAVLQTALTRNTPRWWALLAAEAALAFLCSHPMLFTMVATVCLLWLAFGHPWREQGAPAYTRLIPLALAVAAALLLVAPQLLPMLDLAAAQGKAASAGGRAAEYIASYPFQARDLARLLLPNLYGTVHANVIGGGPAWHETQPFTGAAPLLLGAAGLLAAFRKSGWAFAVALLVVGAALMPAEGNPIHAALSRLPFWGSFRATGRWVVLPIFSLALLSALAITHLPGASYGRRAAVVRISGVLAALIALVVVVLWLTFGVDQAGALVLPGQPHRAVDITVPADAVFNCVTSWEPVLLVAASIIAALVISRLAAGRGASLPALVALLLAVCAPQWHLWQGTNRTAPGDFYADPPRTAIAAARGPRITTLPPGVVAPGWHAPGADPAARAMAARELLTPALGTVWGLRYAEGYKQGLVTPATLELWESYFHYGAQAFTGIADVSPETVDLYGSPVERMERLHALAGVQHIVTPGTIDNPELELTHAGLANVYSYRDDRPRAWLARRAHVVAHPVSQLRTVKMRGFRPYEDVVVDREVVLQAGAAEPPGEVEIADEADTRVRLRASCPGPRVLVLADAWYPGWSVAVDGEPAELLRANFAFRAVALPAGEHQVVFRFRPASWDVALPMCAVGMLVVIALGLWPRRGDQP